MQTRTFQAKNMTEAMQMVKAELGPDAMIISSRKERRKGILGLLTKPVFKITAALEPPTQRRTVSYREEEERGESTRDEFRRSMLEPLARELRELRERVDSLVIREEQGGKNTSAAVTKAASETVAAPRGDIPAPHVESPELYEFKRMLLDSVRAEAEHAQTDSLDQEKLPAGTTVDAAQAHPQAESGPFSRISAALHEAGLGEAAIRVLMEKAMSSDNRIDREEDLMERFKEALETAVKCSGPIRLKKNGTKIVALVGPTGVGKTTTIAKLAALYTMGRKAKVALVTIDTFRVGAVEQLKTYSRIMGVPLEVASTAKELEKALSNHQDKDLILIDTVGRSPRDQEMLEGLRTMLDSSFSIETHLCVAATTRERELRAIVKSFGVMQITRLLVTKLDESSSFGTIVNLQIDKKLPLSYLTRGQRVPEDIEPASGKKVAELILGEG
ncbi:flagellar biosynthesis protein FlhF [bacterium]|nr:flagellar biosynthesis protein FlhF [bacterium]